MFRFVSGFFSVYVSKCFPFSFSQDSPGAKAMSRTASLFPTHGFCLLSPSELYIRLSCGSCSYWIPMLSI